MRTHYAAWLEHTYRPIAGAEAPEATTDEAPAEGEGEAAGGDTSVLESRMDEVLNRVGGMEERWDRAEQAAWQQQQEAQQQPQYGQPQEPQQQQGYEEGYDPNDPYADPTDPQVAEQIIRAEVQRGVQEALGPEFERQAMDRRTSESEDLLEDYPELNDAQAAQGLISDAQQWANDITRDLSRGNPQLAQALVQEPAYLELVHLAAKAAAAAENEATPDQSGDSGVALEGGAPSNPGGGETAQPLGEMIQQAEKRNTFWT